MCKINRRTIIAQNLSFVKEETVNLRKFLVFMTAM